MSHVRLILHGGKPEPVELRPALARLREATPELTLDVAVTFEAGDAGRLAREAVSAGVDGVVAIGGDGTLHEVVPGLLSVEPDRRPWVGVVPRGTGNDFARAAGVPLEDFDAALELALSGPLAPIDVLWCEDRLVANAVTGGATTGVTEDTPEPLKVLLGRAAYLLTGLSSPGRLAARGMVLKGPDFEWSGDALAFGVANGRTAGGGVELAPEGRLDDGLLDVAVVAYPEPDEITEHLERLFEGGFAALSEQVKRWQAPWVELATADASPLVLSLDGEHTRFDSGRAKIKVEIGAVRCRVLPEAPGIRLA